MNTNMLIELTILIGAPIVVALLLRAWYKRQGLSGMAKTTGATVGILATVVGGFLALLGKAALMFAKAGVDSDVKSSESVGLHSATRIYDADAVGMGPGYVDEDKNTYV